VWISVEGRAIRRLVVYDNLAFKELFKAKKRLDTQVINL